MPAIDATECPHTAILTATPSALRPRNAPVRLSAPTRVCMGAAYRLLRSTTGTRSPTPAQAGTHSFGVAHH